MIVRPQRPASEKPAQNRTHRHCSAPLILTPAAPGGTLFFRRCLPLEFLTRSLGQSSREAWLEGTLDRAFDFGAGEIEGRLPIIRQAGLGVPVATEQKVGFARDAARDMR